MAEIVSFLGGLGDGWVHWGKEMSGTLVDVIWNIGGLALGVFAALVVLVVADSLFGPMSNIIRRLRDALRSARRYLGRE